MYRNFVIGLDSRNDKVCSGIAGFPGEPVA